MYTKSRCSHPALFLATILALSLAAAAQTAKPYSFESAKGITIDIIPRANLDFIHAEMLVFLQDGANNPLLPYLTQENLFNQTIHRSSTGLTASMRKLGNDLEVEYRPDGLKLSFNFLPDKLTVFGQFIRELFSYKEFAVQRFTDSMFNFMRHLRDRDDWQKLLAREIAYRHLFPGHPLGRRFRPRDLEAPLNLAQIRSYYRRTYRLDRAYVLIQGNVNPHIAFGTIEKTIASLKKPGTAPASPPPLRTVETRQKVFIMDTGEGTGATIFWFEPVPPLNHPDHFPGVILNSILFAYPVGRLFTNTAVMGVRNIRWDKDHVDHHRFVSVVCNTIHLNMADTPRILALVDRERRRLHISRLNRIEYLDTVNYYLGRVKVENSAIDRLSDTVVRRVLGPENWENAYFSQEVFQQISVGQLNRYLNRNGSNLFAPRPPRSGAVVIAADADRLAPLLTGRNVEIVRFPR